jgi:hypothetical protein
MQCSNAQNCFIGRYRNSVALITVSSDTNQTLTARTPNNQHSGISFHRKRDRAGDAEGLFLLRWLGGYDALGKAQAACPS